MVIQLVKKFFAFTDPHSQRPANGPSAKPAESTKKLSHIISLKSTF